MGSVGTPDDLKSMMKDPELLSEHKEQKARAKREWAATRQQPPAPTPPPAPARPPTAQPERQPPQDTLAQPTAKTPTRMAAVFIAFFVQSIVNCVPAAIVGILAIMITLAVPPLIVAGFDSDNQSWGEGAAGTFWMLTVFCLIGVIFLAFTFVTILGIYVGGVWVVGQVEQLQKQARRVARVAAFIAAYDLPSLAFGILSFIMSLAGPDLPETSSTDTDDVTPPVGDDDYMSYHKKVHGGPVSLIWVTLHCFFAYQIFLHTRALFQPVPGEMKAVGLSIGLFWLSLLQVAFSWIVAGGGLAGPWWMIVQLPVTVFAIIGAVLCMHATRKFLLSNSEHFDASALPTALSCNQLVMALGGGLSAVVNGILLLTSNDGTTAFSAALGVFVQPLVTALVVGGNYMMAQALFACATGTNATKPGYRRVDGNQKAVELV